VRASIRVQARASACLPPRLLRRDGGGSAERGRQQRRQQGDAEAPPAHRSFSFSPAIRICGSTSGFSLRIVATGTPVWWAIEVSVSPVWTV